MKPTTKLEKRVMMLSGQLSEIPDEVKKWFYQEIVPHYCTHRKQDNSNHCMECGYEWQGEFTDICPHCGAKLIECSGRRRTFVSRQYLGLIQKVEDFTVVRIAAVYTEISKDKPKNQYAIEVLQHWVNDNGKSAIVALHKSMNARYSWNPFSLNSELEIRKPRVSMYGYYDWSYRICPDAYYPKIEVTDKVKRNGFKKFKSNKEQVCAEEVIRALLTDSQFETLWKAKQKALANYWIYGHKERIIKYWKSICICMRNNYTVNQAGSYFDYLDNLKEFNKDLYNAKYVCPSDFKKEHDYWERRKAIKEEEKRQLQLREIEERERKVLENKAKYFDISFQNQRMMIVVLKSIEEYQKEGKSLGHCVYTNRYYGKPTSLILSARLIEKPAKPVETIEVSLESGKVLQCYGKGNTETKYHEEILSLVNTNITKILCV